MAVDPIIPASEFQISNRISGIIELGEGNIHQSFIVKTAGDVECTYLLQHKNKKVFRDVPAMMQNISLVSDHLRKKAVSKGLDPLRHTLTLVPSRSGENYFVDAEGEYWTMCVYIRDSVTYTIPADKFMAFSGGRGTGEFHNDLSDFTGKLTDILPGFHNMRFRFDQWDQVISKISPEIKSEFAREIDWIESRREDMMRFRGFIENGEIPVRVAHNDAKLLNILFDREGKSLCLIDLDTVLYGSVLYDYGDAIRSYTNTGEEDDRDTGNLRMNMEYYESFTKGYIREASAFLSIREVESLAFAARYITFEQLLRFLMDYLDGSHYYRISYPDHNLVRARAQFALLSEMEKYYGDMVNHVFNIYRHYEKH
jgi:hypothetical protein